MGRFDTRTRILIGAVCLLAVLAGLMALRIDFPDNVIRNDTQIESLSAVGNRAFMRLLERQNIPVETDRSRSLSLFPVNEELRIVMGRPVTAATSGFIRTRLSGRRLIVVLPKWQVTEDAFHPGWVADAVGLPVENVESMLSLLTRTGSIVRPIEPVIWSINELGYEPTLTQPQLFTAKNVRSVVGGAQGMLIGEIAYGSGRIWVVADPDLLANHGLHRGNNAALAIAMIGAMLPAGGSVVFDTATPIPVDPPSIETLLFKFPTAIVSVQIAVMCLLLLWAAAASFGKRLSLPRPIATGSASLIANMSALLILGGHMRSLLARYAEATTRDVAQRLHAPPGLGDTELARWLERVERARGVGESLDRLKRRLASTGTARSQPDARHTMALAADFHQWRQEMIRGPGNDRDR
jgi:Domain of unknown function (DUF4350)